MIPFRRGAIAATRRRAAPPAALAATDMLLASSPWKLPIPANPVLDSNSATWVSSLISGSEIMNLWEYAIPVYTTDGTAPRYTVTPAQTGNWGPNPFGSSNPIPIPNHAIPAVGTDAWMCIIDTGANRVYCLWQASKSGSVWNCTWGDTYPFRGKGTNEDQIGGTGNGAGVNVCAGLLRLDEAQAIAGASNAQIIAGDYIPHALSFSSSFAGAQWRYPASKTDNSSSVPQGARVQLSPSYDLNGMSSPTKGELAVARALQRYGAFLYDGGGASLALIAETDQTDQTGTGGAYNAIGFGWDYFGLLKIPWSQLRVLASWDGT